MTKLEWGKPGTRLYQTGLDRGVLYVGNEPGVPWSGLISLDEKTVGSEVRSYYQDGNKYLQQITPGEYAATLTAYSSPPAFDRCDGMVEFATGLSASHQQRTPFSLAYRTSIGNDLRGNDYGYKYHFVYDAQASPSGTTHTSIGSTTEPTSLAWELSTVPIVVPGLLPSAHFTLNSRTMSSFLKGRLEDILYGSSSTAPRIPYPDELKQLILDSQGTDDLFTEFFEAVF